MLIEIQEPELQKWTMIFTEENTTKEDIRRLVSNFNADLKPKLNQLLSKTIKDDFAFELQKKSITNTIVRSLDSYVIPMTMIKLKWFDDYVKILESSLLATAIGLKLGKNQENLIMLADTTFEFNIKKSSAQINRGYEQAPLNEIKGHHEINALIASYEEKKRKKNKIKDIFDVISAVEIYQSLRKTNSYRKPYSPYMIVEFLKGSGGQLIQKDIRDALTNVLKV